MAKNGKGLAAIALIIGLLGAGFGGYIAIKEYVLTPDEDINDVLPKARVYSKKTGYLIPSGGAYELIDFTNVTYDTHNAYNLTSDQYLVPESGFYHVHAQLTLTANAGDYLELLVYYNGSLYSHTATEPNLSIMLCPVSISCTVNATIGEPIEIGFAQYNGASAARTVCANSAFTYCEITKIL